MDVGRRFAPGKTTGIVILLGAGARTGATVVTPFGMFLTEAYNRWGISFVGR